MNKCCLVILMLVCVPKVFAFEEQDLNPKATAKTRKTKITEAAKVIAPATPNDETVLYFEDENDADPVQEINTSVSQAKAARAHSQSAGSDIGFSLGIGVSDTSFSARASMNYPLQDYVYIDPSAFYQSEIRGDYNAKTYGGEIDLVLRLQNPTMFTPYAGAGPGFEAWQKSEDHVVLDQGNSVIAAYFVGLLVHFTKNFGMTVALKEKRFLFDSPATIHHGKAKDGRDTVASVEVGFQVMF